MFIIVYVVYQRLFDSFFSVNEAGDTMSASSSPTFSRDVSSVLSYFKTFSRRQELNIKILWS